VNRTYSRGWTTLPALEWLGILVAIVAMSILLGMASCSPVAELCIEHPKYGRLCVTMSGGKVSRVTAALAPEDQAAAEAFAREALERNDQ
jgi:hypothetical protein